MSVEKYQDGMFVFYRISPACVPMFPDEIRQKVDQHQIPAHLVPPYAGDRATVLRAISQTKAFATKQGLVLTNIPVRKKGDHTVVYSINSVRKEEVLERADFAFEDRLRWNEEQYAGEVIGSHPVAQQVDSTYKALRGKVMAADWTDALTTYLRNDCLAQPMRENGYIYYCVPSMLAKVEQLQGFLTSIGIDLVICTIEAAARPVVQQVARESLAEQLQDLQEKVAAFDGTQAAASYRAQIAEYQRLRKRATLYHETLNVGVDQAQAILDDLEQKVKELLSIRESIVIHKDGTADPLPGGRVKLVKTADPTTLPSVEAANETLDEIQDTAPLPSALPARW